MRSLRRRALALSAFLAALALPAGAGAEPPGGSKPRPAGGGTASSLKPHLLRSGEYLPVSALKPGMKGYGLTIFRGTTIEKFDVEVLGVLRRVNNGRDLIFVKLGGPNMRRFSDVISGMSGSPVYIDGKIVGAVAYGAEFTKEPVGYLTPIQDMLDALDPDLPQSADLPAPTVPNGLRPLLTPVSLSGVPRSRFGRWAAELEKLGLKASRHPLGAAAVPGSVGPNGKPLRGSALLPGGAVAMSLATGDIDLSAIGTLTYRRGKEIVAFGHPFLGIGPIDAPMFTATIHDVQPSFAESQKIGSSVSLVGAFSQDRPFSIGGRVGAVPKMIPISVKVNDKSFRRSRTFNAKLVRHPLLTAQLVPLAAGSAIAEVHGQPGDAMATVKYTVETDGAGTLSRTDRVFDAFAIDEAATRDLTRLMGLLAANPFQPVAVKRIAMDVTIEPGRRTAAIERVFLKQGEFEPGDTVEVGVVLKPYKSEERVVKTVPVTIPKSAPAGSLILMVQGGASAGMGAGGGGPMGGGGISIGGGGMLIAPGAGGGVANLKQLLREFQERERGDALVARLLLPTSSVSIQGERLSDLPPHLDAAIRAGRSSGLRMERDEVKTTVLTDHILSGAQMLPIRVVRKGAPAAPPSAAPPPSDPGDARPIPASPPGGVPPGGGPPGAGLGVGIEEGGEEDPETAIIRELRASAAADDAPPVRALPPLRTDGQTTAAPPKVEGAEPEEDVEENKAASPTARSASRVVGRLPSVWRQASAADFRGALTRRNVTVTGQGEVRLAPSLTKVAETAEPQFWCLAPDGRGGVYAGSGDRGVVYHVPAAGRATEFARTGELQVHALARGADGTLYAGTSPNGRLFAIGPDGTPKLLLDSEEPYILGLALAPDGSTLYVGAGGKRARVYAVPVGVKGEAAQVYEGDEGSVTAVAVSPDGKSLYAGTSPGGLVVRIPLREAGARPAVLFDTPAAAVTGLAPVADGSGVYAATGPARGGLYHVGEGGRVRTLYDRAPNGAFTALQVGPSGTLYTAAGATLYAVPPSGDLTEVRSFEAPSDIQILSVLGDPDGRVWAATGSVGGVYALGGGAARKAEEGELVSSVLDAGAGARWGTIRWSGTPGLTLQTRSGDTATPDPTWSDWSSAYTTPAGQKIASPGGRYLQYRVTLSGAGEADAGPVLRSVEAFYLTPNQAPTLVVTAPKPGEVWNGKRTLRWSANDPDKDALRYEVYLSGDGGATWQKVDPATAPKTTPPAPAGAGKVPNGSTPTAARVEAELERMPGMSPEVRARILRDAAKQEADARAAGQAGAAAPTPPAKADAGGSTAETSLPLDTTRHPDGAYLLKVVASDRAANPADPQRAERVSAEFRIVNTPPVLSGAGKEPAAVVGSDRVLRITGVAAHKHVAVRTVQCRIDGGEWFAAVADDGLFDSGREAFTLTSAGALKPGRHEVEVEAQDEAGNSATHKLTVTVR